MRFLDADGGYFGPVMVAKESRFVRVARGGDDDGENASTDDVAVNYYSQMAYHKNFMRTQNIASSFARRYNDALDEAKRYLNAGSQLCFSSLPTIEFIEPIVAELMENGEEKNILIERYLEGEYKKVCYTIGLFVCLSLFVIPAHMQPNPSGMLSQFNSNMGFIEEEVKKLVKQMKNNDLGPTNQPQVIDLGIIEEGSEEEDDDEEEESDNDGDDDDEGDLFDSKEVEPHSGGDYNNLKDAYFPQAFSHFSYERSSGNFMVVDLQGVLTVKDDGSKVYELTDPVIHQHERLRRRNRRHDRNSEANDKKKWNFGRTDQGTDGMKAFFETHVCNDACRLLGLSEVDPEDV